MLDRETRSAILRLREEGHGMRPIARALGISREAVRDVVASGQVDVPVLERRTSLDAHLDPVRTLHEACKGNLRRVQEELAAHGLVVPYSTLTRFCRAHATGTSPPQRAGRYTFLPGQEMQHDTSPHSVKVGGAHALLQCASLVMCFSHKRFIQCYPRFTRFYAKAFLTEALRFFEAAAANCMLDNSTVIMTGTGKNARPVPEMAAFAERFGFQFVAHEVGDANRSARVEGPFFHVENNFYAGRTFTDLADLNTQLRTWCETYNRTFHRSFAGIPDDLFALERPALRPLPLYVPEPTEVHARRVDMEGYVHLHTNRYSAPEAAIGRDVEVHETLAIVRIFQGHHLLAEHPRHPEGAGVRLTLPGHHGAWSARRPPPPSPEEVTLRATEPAMQALCDTLRQRHGGQALRAMRRLHRIWRDYPPEAVATAVTRAVAFGVHDLDTLERMVLKAIRGDFFRLPEDDHG